jgi:hypothetical protein
VLKHSVPVRWAGHVAPMGRGEACTGFGGKNLRVRDQRGDRGVDGRITLRWIFRKWIVGVWNGVGWLRIETGAGNCECGNEPSGSIIVKPHQLCEGAWRRQLLFCAGGRLPAHSGL